MGFGNIPSVFAPPLCSSIMCSDERHDPLVQPVARPWGVHRYFRSLQRSALVQIGTKGGGAAIGLDEVARRAKLLGLRATALKKRARAAVHWTGPRRIKRLAERTLALRSGEGVL